MRDFLVEIALPTLGYFAGFVIFTIAVATDVVSDPTDIAWQEDAQ